MTRRFTDVPIKWSGGMNPPAEQAGLGYRGSKRNTLDHRIWDTQIGCLTDDR